MTGVLARTLLARPRSRSAAAAFPPRGLVLGTTGEAPVLAAALAGELRARRGSGAALLVACLPTPEPPLSLLATPAARALAERLARRDLPAVARGRLAWLVPGAAVLARDASEVTICHPNHITPGESLGIALRAAAAVEVPAVIAVGGPRPAEVDRALAEFDLIVLAADSLGAATFAAAELEAQGVGAVICEPPRDAARLLALGGWGRLRTDEIGALAAELA